MNKNIYILVLLILCLFFSSCAELFQNKVSMAPGKTGTGSLSDIFIEKTQISQLDTPNYFYVTNGYSPSSIKLTWNIVEGAESYMIERAVVEPIIDADGNITYQIPENEQYEVLEQFVYTTSYEDVIIAKPTRTSKEYNNKYYYKIIAENLIKKYESSLPTEFQVGTLFRPPNSVKASLGTSTTAITIGWDSVDNTSFYNIYRSDYSTGASPYLLASVSGNQTWYNNIISEQEQGKEYYYAIYALNNLGISSVVSNLAMGYALMTGAPETPTNVKLANDSGRGHSTSEIKIEWDASLENDAYYAVFRYSSEDSSLNRLTDKTTNTYWIDNKQLKPGVYYYYQVQTIVENNEGKILKSKISSNIVQGYILSPPSTIFAVKSSSGAISIIWYPSIGTIAEQNTYSYIVYADNDIGGAFSTQVATIMAPAEIQQDKYIHADDVSSYTFYKVITKNSSLVESVSSYIVSPAPSAAIIQSTTKAAHIPGQNANSSGVYPVKITWKKPEIENPVAYHVYRSTKPDSGFRKITETAINASEESEGIFTYIDDNQIAIAGKQFYYKILSLNILGQGAYYSESLVGYGALTYQQYMMEYNKTIKASHKKLTYMHKSPDTAKLGSETVNGTISGTLSYSASVAGLGARITMKYNNYAEFYIDNDSAKGVYFNVSGDTNTSANMSANGTMDGTMICTGMYPGKIYYDNIIIKGGSSAGGTYGIEPQGFTRGEVDYTVGER